MVLKKRLVGESPSSNRLKSWWTNLWKLQIPPKLKCFLWKVYHNAFPSSENLVKRNVPIDPSCKLCSETLESSFHVLFQCTSANAVWKKVGL